VADDIRLYLFECGVIRLPRYVVNAGDALNEERVDNPTPWYLITHPRGNVIIDGGNAPEVAEDPVKHWGFLAERSPVVMTPEQAVLPELERIGIDPASIRWVVQSHLHLDHTGALAVIDRLPNAEVLVTRTEYDVAHNPQRWEAAAYCPADYLKPGVPWSLLEDHEDGYDLFGDGTLICWRTPGHTAGHLSFEVNLPSGDTFLLAIDAGNTLDHIQEKQTPAFMLSIADATRSVRRLRRLAWRSQATLVPGHDPEHWPEFKLAPEYYA
jgi:glyoxylase-like metal-dependent hydrolase (beta-lactamase superfamily II)